MASSRRQVKPFPILILLNVNSKLTLCRDVGTWCNFDSVDLCWSIENLLCPIGHGTIRFCILYSLCYTYRYLMHAVKYLFWDTCMHANYVTFVLSKLAILSKLVWCKSEGQVGWSLCLATLQMLVKIVFVTYCNTTALHEKSTSIGPFPHIRSPQELFSAAEGSLVIITC